MPKKFPTKKQYSLEKWFSFGSQKIILWCWFCLSLFINI